jgi:hypothetical protein
LLRCFPPVGGAPAASATQHCLPQALSEPASCLHFLMPNSPFSPFLFQLWLLCPLLRPVTSSMLKLWTSVSQGTVSNSFSFSFHFLPCHRPKKVICPGLASFLPTLLLTSSVSEFCLQLSCLYKAELLFPTWKVLSLS